MDEPALVRALKNGWIAGAGLDVFQTEPVPPDSELWGLPNVILSPHMALETHQKLFKVTWRKVELFCENLRRYLAGEQLINVMDISSHGLPVKEGSNYLVGMILI